MTNGSASAKSSLHDHLNNQEWLSSMHIEIVQVKGVCNFDSNLAQKCVENLRDDFELLNKDQDMAKKMLPEIGNDCDFELLLEQIKNHKTLFEENIKKLLEKLERNHQKEWWDWITYFKRTYWEEVVMVVDSDLEILTLILRNRAEKQNTENGKKRFKTAIAQDISWTLFRVLELLSSKNQNKKVCFKTVSFLIIDNIYENGSVDSVSLIREIISEIEQSSRILSLAKILFIKEEDFQQSTYKDWETSYLAHHLIPFRRKNNYQQIGDKVREFAESAYQLRPQEHHPLERLDSIYVGIKGFAQYPLIIDQLKPKINMIYAPNDFGKSTIVYGLANSIFENGRAQEVSRVTLWDIYDEKSIGEFSFTVTADRETHCWQLKQEPGKSFTQKLFRVKDPEPEELLEKNLPLKKYFSRLFFFSHESNEKLKIDDLPCLVVHSILNKVEEEIPNSLVKEVFTQQPELKGMLLDLLTTLTMCLSSNSWLNKIEYDFKEENGVITLCGNALNLEQYLNIGEKKILSLAILFLLYFLEGCKYSKVIILDDVFDFLDPRQSYNFLRLIVTFSQLSNMSETQWLIFTYRKSISDYFYYECSRYLKDAGCFNFLRQRLLKKNELSQFSKKLGIGVGKREIYIVTPFSDQWNESTNANCCNVTV